MATARQRRQRRRPGADWVGLTGLWVGRTALLEARGIQGIRPTRLPPPMLLLWPLLQPPRALQQQLALLTFRHHRKSFPATRFGPFAIKELTRGKQTPTHTFPNPSAVFFPLQQSAALAIQFNPLPFHFAADHPTIGDQFKSSVSQNANSLESLLCEQKIPRLASKSS